MMIPPPYTMVPLLVEISAMVTQDGVSKPPSAAADGGTERERALHCTAALLMTVLPIRCRVSNENATWARTSRAPCATPECSVTPPVGCLYLDSVAQKERNMGHDGASTPVLRCTNSRLLLLLIIFCERGPEHRILLEMR